MRRLHKISIIPNVRQHIFLLRKILIVGIPKSTVLVIIFKVFMWTLATFLNGISKKTRSYYKGMMYNVTSLSSSDSEMSSKENKISVTRFKIQIRMHCLYFKAQDHALFKNRQEITAFVLRPLNIMLNYWSGQIISPVTWVWNGLRWSSWWLQFFWNRILW